MSPEKAPQSRQDRHPITDRNHRTQSTNCLPNLLTLPRELRQSILYHSYDAKGLRSPSCWFRHKANGPCCHYPAIEKWTATLKSVDKRWTEDIDYAEKAWKEHHEKMRAAKAKECPPRTFTIGKHTFSAAQLFKDIKDSGEENEGEN